MSDGLDGQLRTSQLLTLAACRGEGVAAAQGITSGIDICVGTLSKAFGAHGGFAALSAPCKRLLLNRGRSYVFSTALPVPIVAGALAALRTATDEVSLCKSAHHTWDSTLPVRPPASACCTISEASTRSQASRLSLL